MQSSALICDDSDSLILCPSSSDTYHTQRRGRQQAGMCTHFVSRRINSLGWSRGPVSFTFTWYIQKQGNKRYTIFSVALECRMISAVSYFSTGILSSKHSLLLFTPEIAASACCFSFACSLISKTISIQHLKCYSITLKEHSV